MTEEEAKDGQGGCQGSRPGVQGGPCGAATHAAMRWGCAAGGGAGSDPGREQGQVWIWGVCTPGNTRVIGQVKEVEKRGERRAEARL